MRLIKMTGGLGNQMFIYALYLRMKSRYKDVRIDLSDMQHYHYHYGYELHRIFDLPKDELTLPQWLKKVLEFLLFRTILERHEHGSLLHYDGPVRWPLVYYKGFYQNLMYFQGHEDEIRRAFTFNVEKASERNRQLVEELEGERNSVALHVRRGDYIKPQFYNRIGCVCQVPYYRRAIDEMSRLVPDAKFYVFSEDVEWVRDNLSLPEDTVFVNWNKGNDSWQDMLLMSCCHHNIICNSTFSWWAAWLNAHADKQVLCPDHWYADDGGNIPLYPDNWMRISTNNE